MRDDDTESLFLLGAGPLAAILLGMILVPLRSYTNASNFTFAFMALTILIAEYGGRRAALATALCSALSLDFFLTQPYLRLTIADKHDIIAFFGLAACGLLAASFGSQRGLRTERLRSAWMQLDLFHTAIAEMKGTERFEFRLARLLDAVRDACPVSAAVVRDLHDTVVAASEHGLATSRLPSHVLSSQTLLPREAEADEAQRRDLPLPSEGARLPLVAGNRQVGWLDFWGNGTPANALSRRTIADVAHLIAIQMEGSGRGI